MKGEVERREERWGRKKRREENKKGGEGRGSIEVNSTTHNKRTKWKLEQ